MLVCRGKQGEVEKLEENLAKGKENFKGQSLSLSAVGEPRIQKKMMAEYLMEHVLSHNTKKK